MIIFEIKYLQVSRAAIRAPMQTSITDPSKSIHTRSQYKTHANLSLHIQRSFKSKIAEFDKISSTIFVAHWASSLGGPGRNLGEQRGGKLTFTIAKPQSGVEAFGVQSSLKEKITIYYYNYKITIIIIKFLQN